MKESFFSNFRTDCNHRNSWAANQHACCQRGPRTRSSFPNRRPSFISFNSRQVIESEPFFIALQWLPFPRLTKFYYFRFKCSVSARHSVRQTRDLDLVLFALSSRVCSVAKIISLRVLSQVHEVEAHPQASRDQVQLAPSTGNWNLPKGTGSRRQMVK